MLCQALKDKLRLGKLNKAGISKRDELEQIWTQTGKKPKGLECLEIPEPLEYLWRWFKDLNSSRSLTAYGPTPINIVEIKAWKDLKKLYVRPWEISALKAMDTVLLNFRRENIKK